MPTLIDTHAWLWWISDERRLSRKARTAIQRASAANDLWISAISIWEVAKKVEKGKLVLDRPVAEWFDGATGAPGLNVRELSMPILVESCRLPQPFHGDPADQMIVATARCDGASLVSKDARLHEYAHVRTVW